VYADVCVDVYVYVYVSEVSGVRPNGKSFRFVSCVRSRGAVT
jgi:hypothetical protein